MLRINNMFPIIILFVLIVVFISLLIFFKVRSKRYESFVINNSVPLKLLKEINNKYKFFSCKNYDESQTYDNNIYYGMISCQDYLIYQLQFKKYDVLKDIKNIENNKRNYDLYSKEVDDIKSFGKFEDSADGFKLNRLLSLEKKMFDKNRLKPAVNFHISISLYCSKINGEIYDSKQKTFNSEQILEYIKKLNNRNGSFYNDREVWDALCRVERGKVSNKMRFSIYQRDGYRCCKCGRSGYYDDLEIDHIKPIAKGGKTTYDNLQTLCRHCNKEKGDNY